MSAYAPLERQFQADVLDMARALDLLAYHTHDSRRSEPGFPDLVLVGPGGVLYRELKTRTGRVQREQAKWLDALTAAGADAAVWRPDQWPVQIEDEMRAIARRPRPTIPRSPRTTGYWESH